MLPPRADTPTCRSFSFCFWKVSIVSSSWWVVRLASTEALCTLVSAWPRGRRCHGGSLLDRSLPLQPPLGPAPLRPGHLMEGTAGQAPGTGPASVCRANSTPGRDVKKLGFQSQTPRSWAGSALGSLCDLGRVTFLGLIYKFPPPE